MTTLQVLIAGALAILVVGGVVASIPWGRR